MDLKSGDTVRYQEKPNSYWKLGRIVKKVKDRTYVVEKGWKKYNEKQNLLRSKDTLKPNPISNFVCKPRSENKSPIQETPTVENQLNAEPAQPERSENIS